MQAIIVYVTTKDTAEARAIGETLVKEKLAACANILDNMQSLYHWNGELACDSEAVLLLKSKENLADPIIERIKKLHSYECPCIICLPIINGHTEYLNWIAENTQ